MSTEDKTTRGKAFILSIEALRGRLVENLKKFGESTMNTPDHQPHTIVEKPGRLDSDKFFEYIEPFSDTYIKGMTSQSSYDAVEVGKKLHFTKMLEQEYNIRYNGSRRHSIRTASCNATRLSIDIPTLFNIA